MRNCTIPEIKKIISELSSSKASDIPIRVLKACSDIISPLLTKFYNIFMQKAIFPNMLKVAQVTPIYKKGDSQLLENYRPVSMLPIFGKLFEKIIYSRLYSFLMTKKYYMWPTIWLQEASLNLSCNKFDFRWNPKPNACSRHFIDLSKAFDTINHEILLEKLCRYGIRGNCLELLKDYLTSRNQLVKFNGEKSHLGTIEFGVPQGSVLGPLLFLIYINDIINCSKTSRFVLFADDTNIFISANNQ